ncbi:MAG: hypothetical protein H7326_08270 [Bdellovibrionaceae bacterium]|nr:hypothetical protein [Pseudobdellovibrionaceae bacterium]
MKFMIALIAIAFAINVQASDKKLGNVIAVERTVENVYATCVDQMQKDREHNPADRYYICKLDVAATSSDSTPGGQRILTVRSPDCTIDTELKDSKVLLMVNGNAAKANFASAKACLKTAMDQNGDTLKFVIFTIE